MAIRSGYKQGEFCWIDLLARNLEEASQFYKELFGWEPSPVAEPEERPYAHCVLEGKRVAGIGQMTAEELAQDRPALWNSYVYVDDVQAICDRVRELGGQVLSPGDGDSVPVSVQDPTGARFGLLPRGTARLLDLVQDYHCCCWNELLTRDIEAARAFYEALFEWEFADYASSDSKYYVVSQQGEERGGMLQMDERWGEMPPSWMVYFAVQSVDLSVDYVRQLGGLVHVHPYDIPEGRFAMVADHQGGAFDVVEMNAPEEDSQ